MRVIVINHYSAGKPAVSEKKVSEVRQFHKDNDERIQKIRDSLSGLCHEIEKTNDIIKVNDGYPVLQVCDQLSILTKEILAIRAAVNELDALAKQANVISPVLLHFKESLSSAMDYFEGASDDFGDLTSGADLSETEEVILKIEENLDF